MTTRSDIRSLYQQACHGAGAAPRWEARVQLDAISAQQGKRVGEVLEDAGCDLAAYFASRPISRPG